MRIRIASTTRSAVVTDLDGDGWTVHLYAVAHPQRPDLGDKPYRRRATSSRQTALDIARDWVGTPATTSRLEELCAFERCGKPATRKLGGEVYYPVCDEHAQVLQP